MLSYPRVQHANQYLYNPQHRSGADSHSRFEQRVIKILDANSGDAPDHVGRLEHLAQIDHPDLPWTMLLFGRGFERERRRAVPAAGIEVDEVHLPGWFLCLEKARKFHKPASCSIGCAIAFASCRSFQRSRRSEPSCSSTTAVRFCTQSPSFT